MCDKAVTTYDSTIQFVPDCYKTQEICDKTVTRCFLSFIYIFLIDIKLNKCVTEVFRKIRLC